MPRGRHRHSPPLHKLLPPLAVAGAAVLCAAGAWLLADPAALRGLVAATAVAALTGAVFMRSWDESAGRRVADLTRARESDQWNTEERIAELEADVDESRELRVKLDAKLRTKRIELAGLRGEHAALLRRYATAETERATALEGRRQLALEAAVEPKALPVAGSTPTASVYLRAAQALDNLIKTAEDRRALQPAATPEGAATNGRSGADTPASGADTAKDVTADEAAADGAPAKETARSGGAKAGKGARGDAPAEDTEDTTDDAGDDADGADESVFGGAGTGRSAAEQHTRPAAALAKRVPGASAIVPYSAQRRPARRPGSGFDFFGTQAGAHPKGEDAGGPQPSRRGGKGTSEAVDAADRDDPAPAPLPGDTPVEREDLADVVGEEALAGRRRSDDPAVGAVIDLTEPDRGEDKAGEADDADDADDATKKDAKGRLEVGGVRSSTG
ncbi:hypothetical protein OG349_15725 [Streptomyces sp. NBC_01317]|uniref:hypothetical protein n=1 Tax=Streptomyces sp. NBC_01317 TaxID=2903822 RepID=UPI002E119E1D|nr:hypothetical protein OG349_15725 [Streptomyces sp. NBC_01317]